MASRGEEPVDKKAIKAALKRVIRISVKAATAATELSASAAVARGRQGKGRLTTESAGTCGVCLSDTGPPHPVHGGCGCDAIVGLEHMACRIQQATLTQVRSGSKVWWQCHQCYERFGGAVQMEMACEAVTQAEYTRDNEIQLSACTILADALYEQGKSAEAELIYTEIYAAQKLTVGMDHPDALKTCQNLALAIDCGHSGRGAEAVDVFKTVLAGQKRTLGAEHRDTLGTANNLAVALDKQGKHGEAEYLYKEVLSTHKRVLGIDHPFALASAKNLALSLADQGKYAEAETAYLDLLAAQKRVIGADHPDTLTTSHNLAFALTKQRKAAEAEAIYWDVMAVSKRVLGSDHPDTLMSVTNLAATLFKQQKFGLAEKMLTMVLEAQVRVLGLDHEDTLSTTKNVQAIRARLEAAQTPPPTPPESGAELPRTPPATPGSTGSSPGATSVPDAPESRTTGGGASADAPAAKVKMFFDV